MVGPRLARTVSCPSLSPPPACPAGTPWPAEAVRETFSAKKPLALHCFVCTYATGQWSLTDKPGSLRLWAARPGWRAWKPANLHRPPPDAPEPALHHRGQLRPQDAGDAAGVALRMNETHHLLLGISAAEKGRQLQCVQRLADKPIVHGTAKRCPKARCSCGWTPRPRPTSLLACWWRQGRQKPGAWQAPCSAPTHQPRPRPRPASPACTWASYATPPAAASPHPGRLRLGGLRSHGRPSR